MIILFLYSIGREVVSQGIKIGLRKLKTQWHRNTAKKFEVALNFNEQ